MPPSSSHSPSVTQQCAAGFTRAVSPSELASPLDRLLARRNAELAVDAPGVRLDGVERDIQLGADLALRELAAEQSENIELGVGQHLRGWSTTRVLAGGQPHPALESQEQLPEDSRVAARANRAPRLIVQPLGFLATALLASQFGQRQERVGDLYGRHTPLGEHDRTADCRVGLLKLTALLMNLSADRERERLRPVLSEAVLLRDRLRFDRV
jgi:hypothetical protein